MQDIPKIVVQRLQGMAITDPHPEPDLLAAFAEQSLAQSERALLLDHLARCAECRQIIALATPEAEPETVPGRGFMRPGWLSLPAIRWGFASAAILALISAGAFRYEHRQAQRAELASSSLQPTQMIAGQTNVSPAQSAPFSQERSQAPSSTFASRDRQPAAYTGISGDRAKKLNAETTTMARNRPTDQLIQKQAQATSPYQSYANSDVVKAKAAVPTQASGATAPAFAPPNLTLQTAPSLMQRASPRWAVTANGGLQRSFDAGKTWQDVSVNAAVGQAQNGIAFRAVAAIGPEVWAGGSGTILYHSSDSGTSWQQVLPSASGAQPAGDITAIEFSSPQQGKITTSAGEIWTTSDNGQTWRKQQ